MTNKTPRTSVGAQEPAGPPVRVFMSYRRTDDPNFIGRLYDHLTITFGEANVFRDIDSIDAGTNFNAKIHDALSRVDVVLVVIGPHWTTKRLGSDTDFVRMEIRGAFERGKQIVPVLIDDVALPEARGLPADIRPILDLNVARVRRDPDFRRDVNRLTDGLVHLVHERTAMLPPARPPLLASDHPRPPASAPLPSPLPRRRLVIGAAAAVLVAGTVTALALRSKPPTSAAHAASPSTTAHAVSTTAVSPLSTTIAATTTSSSPTTEASTIEPPTTDQPATTVTATPPAGGAGRCKSGFVPRAAVPGDLVCVEPSSHDAALADDAAAESRKLGPIDGQYGPDTCKDGYVWRDAWTGDHTCVTPPTRQQAATDNAAAPSRVQGGGPYGPDGCKTGFVWRDGRTNPVDHVCVTPAVRQQAADDNAAASSRLLGKIDGPSGPDTCKTGFVWRDGRTNPVDHVCVTPAVRQQAADDNAAASSRQLGKIYGPNGPDTCIAEYTWRLATPTDHTCVTSERAEQTTQENANRAAATHA
jgi:TIR domain